MARKVKKSKKPRVTGTNKSGITFVEWQNAANFGRKRLIDPWLAVGAWARDEDPSDYAAMSNQPGRY